MPIKAAPNAAGLKRWRPPVAMMYLDAIAQAATSARKPTAARSPGAAGVMIRAMISALMQTDSQLLFAPKTCAKTQLTLRHTDSATAVENDRFTQDWRTIPKTDRVRAVSRIAAR